MVGARFCPSCGRSYEAAGQTPPTAAASGANAALLAGLAWLVSAALTAYLAYQQWSVYQAFQTAGLDTGDLGSYALWNAVSAAITLWFGARVLTKPTRGLLNSSIAWAILGSGSGILQVAQGALSDVFVLSIIATAAAGVLSAAARTSLPNAPSGGATVIPAAISPEPSMSGPAPADAPTISFAPKPVDAAAVEALPLPERDRTSPVLVLAAILTGLLALGVVGYAVLQGPGQGLLSGLAPTPTPVATPTPSPVPIPTPLPFAGTGVISFGTGYDPDTLAIVGSSTKFKRTAKAIAWSAALTGPVSATAFTFLVASRTASGVETTLYTETVSIANPQSDIMANKIDLASLVENKAGSYVLRLIRGADVLAEGTFTLTK